MGHCNFLNRIQKKLKNRKYVEEVTTASKEESHIRPRFPRKQIVSVFSSHRFARFPTINRTALPKAVPVSHTSPTTDHAPSAQTKSLPASCRLNIERLNSPTPQPSTNSASSKAELQPHVASQGLNSGNAAIVDAQSNSEPTSVQKERDVVIGVSAIETVAEEKAILYRLVEERIISVEDEVPGENGISIGLAKSSTCVDDCPSYERVSKAQKIFLANLPTEILLCIVDFLPKSSAATFALCSHEVLRKLGTRPFEAVARGAMYQFSDKVGMQSNEKEKGQTPEQKDCESFLETMFEKHPEMVYCHHCKKAHTPQKTLSDDQDGKRPCTLAKRRCHNRWLLLEEFTFPRVQLIMNQYRQGASPATLQKQIWPLSETLTHYLNDFLNRGRYTEQISYRPRIRSGKLLLRTHRWFLFQANLPPAYKLQICPHLHGYYKRFADIVNCKVSHPESESKDCQYCNGMHKCDVCATEYQLDFMKLPSGNRVLAFTSWRDFGEARTPFDPKWEKHCLTSSSVKAKTPLVKLNGIKNEFGDNENFSFDDHMTGQMWNLIKIEEPYYTVRS